MYEIFPSLAPNEEGSNELRKRVLTTTIAVVGGLLLSAGLLVISPNKGADIAFNMFGLLGATSGNAITYILPGLMWIKLNPDLSAWDLAGAYFITGMGSLFTVLGLVENGVAWVDLFTN